jgi:PAS domain S-box-containing protein
MGRAVWARFRHKESGSVRPSGFISRAAAAGQPTEELLELGARVLLEAGQADRAGVWVVQNREPKELSGPVVDVNFTPVPQEWRTPHLPAPVLGMLLHSKEPVVADRDQLAWAAELGVLSSLQRVIWLPLRSADRIWGLAWAGYAASPVRGEIGLLQGVADELALALTARALRKELEQLRAAALTQAEIQRVIFAGAQPAEVGMRIAQAVVRHSPACWAAVCRLAGDALHTLAYYGPPELAALLHHRTLQDASIQARASFCSVSGTVPGAEQPGQKVGDAQYFLALPLGWPHLPVGILLAGFGTQVHTAETEIQLTPFALLATELLAPGNFPAGPEPATISSAAAADERPPNELVRPAEAELLSLLESVHAGVLIADLSGRIRYTNDHFVQLIGADPRQNPELQSLDALSAAVRDRFRDPQKFAERWRQLRQKGEEAAVDELEMIRPVRRVIERFVRPVLDSDGKRVGWLEVYRDLTQQRMIQTKLVQTEKMAALGQLVSGIAHELNNPLTSIMGYAQLLLSRRLREDRFSDAEKIYQEAERARRLVKNLLLFARETKPERRLVDLNEIVERTLALRSYELKVENISVELHLDPDLPRTAADAHQLQQVVLNLIVNAEQALQHARGSGRIWIQTRRAPGNRVALVVADDGPGIPPGLASRIFDPFFTTKPLGVGTGLGLSIAYGIVQEHGGDISVESQPGQGATFVVELPVVAPAAQPPPAQAPARPPHRARPGRRILVVEDEPTVAQLVVDVLSEQGHQVEAVLDSQEGLYRLSQQDYDLVICDLRMPRLDGRGFYEALVRAGSPAHKRLFFITGDTLAPRTLEFLEKHQIPYLAKPFLVEELTLAVNRLLANHHGNNDSDKEACAAASPVRKK